MHNTKKNKRVTIDSEVDHILAHMATLSPASEEYTNCAKNLETVCKAKSSNTAGAICWDTVIAAGTGVLQVGMIIWHERLNVISSKALSYVFKPKGG